MKSECAAAQVLPSEIGCGSKGEYVKHLTMLALSFVSGVAPYELILRDMRNFISWCRLRYVGAVEASIADSCIQYCMYCCGEIVPQHRLVRMANRALLL